MGTTNGKQNDLRQNRESWLESAVELMRPVFEDAGAPLPVNLAVSCSWPSGDSRAVIGECWVAEASARKFVEIFITPAIADNNSSQGVLATLIHELVHAAGRRGHKQEFKSLATQMALTGPMTATVASPELQDFINWTLLPQLGTYPHGALAGRGEIVVPPGMPGNPGDVPIILRPDDRPKRQSTRLLKAECPCCGYVVRLTRKWAEFGMPSCPSGTLLELTMDTVGELEPPTLVPAATGPQHQARDCNGGHGCGGRDCACPCHFQVEGVA